VVTQPDDHGYTLALAVRRGKWPLLGLWAGLAALAIGAAGRTGKRLDVRGGSLRPTEASRAAALLETRFPRDVGETFVLVVTGSSPTPVDTARAHAVLDDLSATLSHEPYIADVAQVAAPHGGQSVALVTLNVSDPDSVLALVPVVRSAVRRALDGLPDGGTFRALVTGDTPLEHDMLAVTTADVERSEWRLVPITGAILLVALGSPVAAVLPLLVGILAIVTAQAVVGSVAAALPLPVSVYALNVTTMIGLAVGIDYSLLVVTRFSEELERDGSATEAAARTLRSAGRTVAASGLTVAVGFAALLATPLIETRSIGLGGLVAVACAVALALTMLPALLAVLGRGHRFGAWRGIAGWGTQARWGRWAAVIARHPGRALLVGGAVIGILTAPLAGIRIGLPARHWWPPGTEGGAGLELLAKLGGAGYVQPIRVTVEWPPGRRAVDPGALRALRALSDSLRADPRVRDIRSLVDLPGRRSLLEYALLYADLSDLRARHPGLLGSLVSLDERVARLDVVLADTVSPLSAMDAVRRVRGLAAGSGLLQSARVLVGGYVAENVDVQAELGSAFPLVAGWIFGATAIVLGLVFRSVLIPLKAILLNAASVGAAFGLVVIVFQRGHGSALFGAPGASEAVFAAVPILLFAILFGLSIDYEVFLLGRIAEAYRPAGDNDAATRDGLAASAGVITWAALLMVAVFGVFAFSRVPVIQQLGFGLAAAVLLDATVIRLALAPALLHLAGRWNWWPGGGRGRA
jgi:RND superfamily putative drug exporter